MSREYDAYANCGSDRVFYIAIVLARHSVKQSLSFSCRVVA
jgi:hypothetical protein